MCKPVIQLRPTMSAVVLFVAFMSFLLLWKTYLLKRKKAMNLPPLAGGALPIVGHTFLLSNKKRLLQVVKDTMLGFNFNNGAKAATVHIGFWKLYVVMDPDDGYLLTNSCLKKDIIYGFMKPLLGDYGLITADVPVWKRHRKLLNPTFNQSVLDTYIMEFNEQSRQLINDLAHHEGNGSFNQLSYVKLTVLQVICDTIIGVNVDEQDMIERAGKAIQTFSQCIVERSTKFWLHNDFFYSFSNIRKKQEKAAKSFLDLTYEVIRKKKAKLIKQKDHANECQDTSEPRFKSFLDLILDLPKDESLTESEIREEVNTFIAAGFDTTYHALSMTLLILGSYPEVQQKVYEELQDVFEDSMRDVTRQDLSKLKYLDAVINESMRLYPVVFGVGRVLDKDLHFKNYSLPAGSRCYMSIYHVGRHPMWGPDAELFRPERWLNGSLPTNTRAFAVFGLGKRSCIGSKFSMMLMKIILSHMVRRYHISGDVTQLVQNLDIVVTPVSGHHISIEMREAQNMKGN